MKIPMQRVMKQLAEFYTCDFIEIIPMAPPEINKGRVDEVLETIDNVEI